MTHFTQPDTIIPNPYNPADWDRYSYVRNNPIRYTDPTGHLICGGGGTQDCNEQSNGSPSNNNNNNGGGSSNDNNNNNGICINGIGCSGTLQSNWDAFNHNVNNTPWLLIWILEHPQEASGLTDEQLNELGAILNLGIDGYDNWKGIPLPKKYGYGLDFFVQLLKDSDRGDLSYSQMLARAFLNSGEGIVTSNVSNFAGITVGNGLLYASLAPSVDTGQLWLPPVAYYGGYVSTYLAVNYSMGGGFDAINGYAIYPLFGLGAP